MNLLILILFKFYLTICILSNDILKTDTSVLPCLIQITCGCQKQLAEFPLVRGILADLSVFFKDLIRNISNTVMVS